MTLLNQRNSFCAGSKLRSVSFRNLAWITAALLCLGNSATFAQQGNIDLDYHPQKNTKNLIPFSASINSPDVHDDRTVTFRVKAPDVQSVSLTGVAILTALKSTGKPMAFKKNDQGIWGLTVGPMQPDMYQYYLLIDGVRVADPNNTVAGFTAMPPYSTLVVPRDGPAYYDARDVPHGLVIRHVYHSNVTNGSSTSTHHQAMVEARNIPSSIWSVVAATCLPIGSMMGVSIS